MIPSELAEALRLMEAQEAQLRVEILSAAGGMRAQVDELAGKLNDLELPEQSLAQLKTTQSSVLLCLGLLRRARTSLAQLKAARASIQALADVPPSVPPVSNT